MLDRPEVKVEAKSNTVAVAKGRKMCGIYYHGVINLFGCTSSDVCPVCLHVHTVGRSNWELKNKQWDS